MSGETADRGQRKPEKKTENAVKDRRAESAEKAEGDPPGVGDVGEYAFWD